jgi:N4-gp56 family major capsid protein
VANVFTGTATISDQTGLTNLVQTAYDKYVEMALRSEPLWRMIADKRPVDVTSPGSSVVFAKYSDLATATTPLTENVDPDAVAISNPTQVTVTLNEYGNAVLATEKLRLESLSDVDPAIADIIAFNMRDTLDSLVRTVAVGGSNYLTKAAGVYSYSGNVNTVTSTTYITAEGVRKIVAKLRAASAVPISSGLYACYIHPDVSMDLRQDAGTAGWRSPHEYSGADSIWNGVVGIFEGAFFVETPRTYSATDGSSSAKVHRTVFAGKQAIAEAVAKEPGTVIGPVTDKLMRFRPIGWKGLLGWARYREESLWRLHTSASQ